MILKQLKSIVGEGNVSDEVTRKIVHSTDSSMLDGNTKAVVWPTTVEQARRIIAYANKRKIQLAVRGGGTGLAGGCATKDEVVLDTTRMNKIIKVGEEKKLAVVQPGVILADLNGELKELGLFFPVIPGSQTVCTIGGMIATNAAGVRSVKYGSTKDWVEQVSVVTGDGRLVTTKDTADFAGKEGVTGMIVEAVLKLTEPFKHRTLTMKRFDDPESLVEEVLKMKEKEGMTAIEFFNKKSAELAGYKPGYYLVVEFENDEGEEKDIKKIEEYWQMREGMHPIVAKNGFTISEDPKLPHDKIPPFLRWLEEKGIPCFGHIGLGIVHPIFSPEKKHLIKEMFRIVEESGGDVSGEHGIGITKKEYAHKDYIESVKKLKAKYNKSNIINRGRIC